MRNDRVPSDGGPEPHGRRPVTQPSQLQEAERAVVRLTRTSSDEPLAFTSDLAWALSALANARSRAGDVADAVRSAEEAVERAKTLTRLGSVTFRRWLPCRVQCHRTVSASVTATSPIRALSSRYDTG